MKKFQILKATKFCANSKLWNFSSFPVFTSKILQQFYNYRVLLQTARATHKYLNVLKLKKKLHTFSLLQFYDAAKKAKKSLLKLTEHSELNTKITWKTWSFKLTWTFSEFKN